MRQRYRRGYTAAEKTELWDRWQRGESLKAIGRAFCKPSSSIYFQLAPHGGIRPAPRRRSRLALTLSEREEISRGIVAQQSIRSMASLLGRSPSTVSREVRRNGGYDQYRAALADERTWARARRPKRCKLAMSSRIRRAVARKLRLNWSPEQIAGWLKRAHPGDGSYHVSHETIYRSLFVQARGVLKKELLQHLRSKRTIRRSRHANGKDDSRNRSITLCRASKGHGQAVKFAISVVGMEAEQRITLRQRLEHRSGLCRQLDAKPLEPLHERALLATDIPSAVEFGLARLLVGAGMAPDHPLQPVVGQIPLPILVEPKEVMIGHVSPALTLRPEARLPFRRSRSSALGSAASTTVVLLPLDICAIPNKKPADAKRVQRARYSRQPLTAGV